jgi:hypothetical protein
MKNRSVDDGRGKSRSEGHFIAIPIARNAWRCIAETITGAEYRPRTRFA